MRVARPTSVLLSGLALTSVISIGYAHAAAGDSEAQRAERWSEIKQQIFPGKTIQPGGAAVKIEAPKRAEDASLVPITLTAADKDKIAELSLIIDDNPTPYAAHFVFGPAADPGELKLRVRVNNYTDVHAVAQMKDGSFVESTEYVKASGGCSAPMGMSDEEAMQGMGDMRMKFGETHSGKPVQATLMIRHPNFSGMQMNQVSRDYTPARYIQKITVSYGDKSVFTMDGDISISSNPVINFAYLPEGSGPMKVTASDNQGGHWEQSFPVRAASN
ncbi:quinoprotein dehydrogenase-associated SoxYZ-like carrier [Methylobacterium brachythecii]|uniref:Quinoprotein dehydrogenase-associated SoxYZ-like carrier n=1 Tax=Methylobacterium brachythecii TaxID=1176177 RepID=A0A7W6AG90_9HYPH|nr:quinoprotein dehydrogenase-associated SoxYZ-like carrier [Methylobacterium brachythecii]MBB3902757.1 sulfur-oxidizing protein SoxY [Methylobacterium brachythecii]GLS42600.1 quinoprotein dehydrogenase-associated SoxYZ-like carrier [Methylobacterium brachythecii]